MVAKSRRPEITFHHNNSFNDDRNESYTIQHNILNIYIFNIIVDCSLSTYFNFGDKETAKKLTCLKSA